MAAPVLAVGDGALGFEVISKSPDTRSTGHPMSSGGTPSQSQHSEPTERTIQ
jgi:hypothetical protein